MKCTVRILRRARGDLLELQSYVATDNSEAADRVVADLLDLIASLENVPKRGASPRDPELKRREYRFLVYRDWLIFYKVLGRRVRVYRVLHGRRAYAELL